MTPEEKKQDLLERWRSRKPESVKQFSTLGLEFHPSTFHVFRNMYLGEPYEAPEDVQTACKALYAYNSLPDRLKKYWMMREVAEEHHTTIPDMTEHWRCIERGEKCWRDE